MATRRPTASERKLADIVVQVAVTAATYMKGQPPDVVGPWAATQLAGCGYYNQPVGANYASLTEVEVSNDQP